MRIGVTASMHPNVVKISLDELTRKLQRDTTATRESPESGRLRTLTEELNSLRKTKSNLIAAIDAANKVNLKIFNTIYFLFLSFNFVERAVR